MDTQTPKPAAPWGKRILRWLLVGLAGIIVLFGAYLWFVLSWSYSDGERAGYVQKFSKKGVIVKTWEGELTMVVLPGTTAEKFLFTVRDDAVAEQVSQTLGKRVSLTYEEHVGVPTSIFGETSYFVTGVRTIE